MRKAVKIKMCKMIMKPFAVCGNETWAMTEMNLRGQGTRDKKILLSKEYG